MTFLVSAETPMKSPMRGARGHSFIHSFAPTQEDPEMPRAGVRAERAALGRGLWCGRDGVPTKFGCASPGPQNGTSFGLPRGD